MNIERAGKWAGAMEVTMRSALDRSRVVPDVAKPPAIKPKESIFGTKLVEYATARRAAEEAQRMADDDARLFGAPTAPKEGE